MASSAVRLPVASRSAPDHREYRPKAHGQILYEGGNLRPPKRAALLGADGDDLRTVSLSPAMQEWMKQLMQPVARAAEGWIPSARESPPAAVGRPAPTRLIAMADARPESSLSGHRPGFTVQKQVIALLNGCWLDFAAIFVSRPGARRRLLRSCTPVQVIRQAEGTAHAPDPRYTRVLGAVLSIGRLGRLHPVPERCLAS